MNDQTKAWTTAWHAVLDEELGTEADPKVEERYSDPGCDFRLHFDFWNLPKTAQRKCFEMLPLGKEIADRVIDHPAWETNLILSEKDAKHMLVKAIEDVERLMAFADYDDEIPVKKDDPIRVMRGTREDLEALGANQIEELWLIPNEMWYDLDMPDDCSHASSFMTETLYRASSYYEGVYHTLWPYVENKPDDLDPFANLLRMRRCEIEWLYDEDGPIIFYNDDETIRDGGEVTLHLDGRGLQNVSDQITAFIKQKSEHHLKRGFSPERLQDVDIGISGGNHKNLKRRPKDNPEGPDLVERGWTSLSNGELIDPDYALFYEGQEDGSHRENIHLMLHFINGERQREKRKEKAG